MQNYKLLNYYGRQSYGSGQLTRAEENELFNSCSSIQIRTKILLFALHRKCFSVSELLIRSILTVCMKSSVLHGYQCLAR